MPQYYGNSVRSRCIACPPHPTLSCQSSGGDVLAELLDAEQARAPQRNRFSVLLTLLQGSQVRDTGIFRAHAARYEAEFLEDMARLGA